MSAPSQYQASQPVPSATYAGWDAITQQQPLWSSAGGSPAGTSGNGGINGVNTSTQLPGNTNTTPLLTFTFEAGSVPTSANVTASITLTNATAFPLAYNVLLYEGDTSDGNWAVTNVPNQQSAVISVSRYFPSVTGSTSISLLINASGSSVPVASQTYINPTILAVWGGV